MSVESTSRRCRESGEGVNPQSAIRNPQSDESAIRNPQSGESAIRNPQSGATGEGVNPQSAIRNPQSTIRILPPEIVNRIAAGEVIERPASVLKELVENAIDADSTEVTVVLEEGGKKRILVRDNGRGMTPEDLPLAFHSHATSKLREDDLLESSLGSVSLGFRGEALASIGSVAMVEVVSRTPWAEHASRYRPGSDGPAPAAGEPGTSVEVRDLFYNIPARRKFLRTGATELSHCVQQFLRIAMACPGVHMRLFHGQRSVLDLLATAEVGERLRQVLSRKISDHLVEVSEGDDPELPRLEGFIGEPRVHRRDTKEQHFFVGGRWVRDRTLAHALRSAYQGFLIPGYQPVAYLFIDCPRGEVDANVHPTKTEVRFRDSSAIYRLVHHGVRRALEGSRAHGEPGGDLERGAPDAGDPFGPEAARYTTKDFFAEISGSRQSGSTVFDWTSTRSSRTSSSMSRSGETTRRFGTEDDEDEDDQDHEVDGAYASMAEVPAQSAEESAENGRSSPGSRVLPGERHERSAAVDAARSPLGGADVLQVMNSFLVVALPERVLLLDQHALHEIILFEEIYRRLVDGVVESQRLLVPDVVRVSPEYLPLVETAAELLGKFGFEMESFGPDSVALHAIPAVFDREAGRNDLAAMVGSVLENLQDGFVRTSAGRVARERDVPMSVDERLRHIGATIACKRAVKAGMPLSQEEMRSLLKRAGSAVDPRHCPHGRPTVVSYSRAEIERMFDRR